mgnify:CR=1 FL=1
MQKKPYHFNIFFISEGLIDGLDIQAQFLKVLNFRSKNGTSLIVIVVLGSKNSINFPGLFVAHI